MSRTRKGSENQLEDPALVTSSPSSDGKELTVISDLISWAARQERAEKRVIDTKADPVGRWLDTQPFYLLDADAVSSRFQARTYNSTAKSEFVRLPKVDSGEFVALLSFKYNWERSWPELRLRVGLYTADAAGAIRATGFRFESPEPGGRHEFLHMQPIRQFSKSGPALPCPSWMPDKEPTVPLWGGRPVDLMMSLLLSLYGTGVLMRIGSAGGNTVQPWLSAYRDRLRSLRSRTFLYERANQLTAIVTWLSDDALKKRARSSGFRKGREIPADERGGLDKRIAVEIW